MDLQHDGACEYSRRTKQEAKFGFGRIASDPRVVVERAIKRGRILNNKELEVIRDILSEHEHDHFSAEERSALQVMANRYELMDR